jgi:serpin B
MSRPLVRRLFTALALALAPSVTHAAGMPDSSTALARGANAFAFELYARLAHASGNVFFSPFSVHGALAMVDAGARGATQAAIAKTMHYPADAAELGAAYRALLADLNASGRQSKSQGSQLEVANALWASDRVQLEPAYTSAIERDYGGVARALDFADPAHAAGQINGWVAERTHQRIRDLVSPSALNAMTSCVLTNAIYFKGHWMSPFRAVNTREKPFHLASGASTNVPTMFQLTRFDYAEATGLQLLTMGYADGRLSMTVLLPRQRDGLAAIEHELTAAKLEHWLASAKPQRVDVNLPRFTFTRALELTGPLSAMGLEPAFDDAADFSAMSTTASTKLSKVVHKAFVAVDEAGTEAAAATGAVMALTAMSPEAEKPPIVFHADHPFVFLIRDEPSGAILFLGRVDDPRPEP